MTSQERSCVRCGYIIIFTMAEYIQGGATRYDAIIALSASVDLSGAADAESKQRVAAAVGLYNDGVAPCIVMSGDHPFRMDGGGLPPAADGMRGYAIELGVRPGDVLVQRKSLETIGDAVLTKQDIVRGTGWRRLVVVTTETHLDRARGIFTHVYGSDYEVVGHSSGEFGDRKNQRVQEIAAGPLLRAVLSGTQPGKDEVIKERLYRIVPGYEAHSVGERVMALMQGMSAGFRLPEAFSATASRLSSLS
jgi:hypothetical protein